MPPTWPRHWLTGVGFLVRPWPPACWWIMDPATRTISVLTLPELLALVRVLERDFRSLVVTVANGSTPN